jgi:hypothetical protein
MIISAPRFAAGYTYQVDGGRYESLPFDDIGDMLIYADKHPEHKIVAYWVHDFKTEEWIDAEDAFYVFSHHLETPMAMGTAAVDSREEAGQLAAEYHGEVLDWNGLRVKHHAGELVVSLVSGTAMGDDGANTHSHETMMHGAPDVREPPLAPTCTARSRKWPAQSPGGRLPGRAGESNDDRALVMLGAVDTAGYHLMLLAHGPLHAGYNHLMLHVTNPDGETVTQADVSFNPLMQMSDMTHAAPVEQPGAYAHSDGYFGGAVGFPMPGGPDLGDWKVDVTFNDPASNVQGDASFPIEVAPAKLSGSFVAADDESRLFLMIVLPQKAGVGLQPIEILAVEKKSAMEWPPVDDLRLEIVPEMPTMGHGSPDNEHPVGVSGGHYRGKVNFTMDGPWTVTVKVRRGGIGIGAVVFEFDVR